MPEKETKAKEYQRKKEKILKQHTRKKIYKHIAKNPGILFSNLVMDLNLSKGNCEYHLSLLMEYDHIKDLKFSTYRRLYQKKYKLKKNEAISPTQKKILKIINNNPGITQREIVKITDISQPTVSRCLKDLELMELVRFKRENRVRNYYKKK